MKLCGFDIGLNQPFFLIAGPCVVESEQLQMDTAGALKEITAGLGIPFIFKSSFDKANRSSGTSFRGPGRDKGLEIMGKVKREPLRLRLVESNDLARLQIVRPAMAQFEQRMTDHEHLRAFPRGTPLGQQPQPVVGLQRIEQ